MAKRHKDALAITQGACNPSGIALSIVEACREIRSEPNHTAGTAQITSDPAIRLMAHQLAFICGLGDNIELYEYIQLSVACQEAAA